MIQAFISFLRRSIARKLTLTLVGFVAVTFRVTAVALAGRPGIVRVRL